MKLTNSDYPVIDLKANFGDRYRVKRDECGDQLIPHKWGHFYAHSATEIACFVNGNKKFQATRRQFPEIRVTQHGDQEIIFAFAPSLLPELAKAFRASKRRQVSEKERQRLAEMGRDTQFPASNNGVQDDFTEKLEDFPLSGLGDYPKIKEWRLKR